MERGVFAWPVIWPNEVGLVRLRLAHARLEVVHDVGEREEELGAYPLLVDVQFLHHLSVDVPGGKPRGPPPPPQRVSRPSTQGRNSLYTCGRIAELVQAVQPGTVELIGLVPTELRSEHDGWFPGRR